MKDGLTSLILEAQPGSTLFQVGNTVLASRARARAGTARLSIDSFQNTDKSVKALFWWYFSTSLQVTCERSVYDGNGGLSPGESIETSNDQMVQCQRVTVVPYEQALFEIHWRS